MAKDIIFLLIFLYLHDSMKENSFQGLQSPRFLVLNLTLNPAHKTDKTDTFIKSISTRSSSMNSMYLGSTEGKERGYNSLSLPKKGAHTCLYLLPQMQHGLQGREGIPGLCSGETWITAILSGDPNMRRTWNLNKRAFLVHMVILGGLLSTDIEMLIR